MDGVNTLLNVVKKNKIHSKLYSCGVFPQQTLKPSYYHLLFVSMLGLLDSVSHGGKTVLGISGFLIEQAALNRYSSGGKVQSCGKELGLSRQCCPKSLQGTVALYFDRICL